MKALLTLILLGLFEALPAQAHPTPYKHFNDALSLAIQHFDSNHDKLSRESRVS